MNSFFITGSIFNIFSERFASLFTHSDISVTHRTYLLDVTKDIIRKNSVFGVGSGKFTYYLANLYSIYVDNVMLLQPVHNIFALFAAEYGMFISFTLAFLYGYLFIHNFVIKNNYMKIVKIIILITIIIIGSFDHYLLTLPQGLALLVFMLTYSLL